MLYKFKSKAAGDVIMTGPVGDRVLRAMGRGPAAQGIFESSALSSLIGTLEAAIADDEASRKSRAPANADAKDGPAAEEGLSLRQRAWPLVELMRRALAEKVDVVWGV